MIKLKARPVTRGVAEGEAMVSHMAISFTGGMDPDTGRIREPGHDLEGQIVAGKILVFPTGKGSTTGSWQYYAAFKRGNAPKAIINTTAEGVVAVSAIITGTPMVHELEKDPLECIENGDFVKVDADNGIVEIEKRKKE
ncbi:MAG: aconitase X swivel domain-containing protein [Desulfatiglandales bacterium]